MKTRLLAPAAVLLLGFGVSAAEKPPGSASPLSEDLPSLPSAPADAAAPLPPGTAPRPGPGIVLPGGLPTAPAGAGLNLGALPPFNPGTPGPLVGPPAPGGAGGWLGLGPGPACTPLCSWVTAEYLLWQVRRGPLPVPLVTTPRDPVPGALAENPDSVLLFPTNGLNYNSLSGARLGVGCWCDDHAFVGVEASGFFLGSRSTRTSFSSGPNGAPRLDVPVFDAATNQEDSVEISTPGETTGKINIASSSRLWGAEGNGLLNLYRDQGFSFDLLGGFRYLGLREDLTIDTYLAALPFAAVAFGGNIYGAPAATTTFDRFTTDNNFFGGQLGAKGRWQFGGLFLDVAGKVALGDTHQVLRIAGNSGLLIGGVNAATLPGGIFAQTTNIGRYSGDAFSVVPEVSARLGYKVTENVVVFAGYNFIYWSSVLRPGNQIDRAVNDTIAPTSNAYGAAQGDLSRPQPLFNTSGFWAHGVSWGLELRF